MALNVYHINTIKGGVRNTLTAYQMVWKANSFWRREKKEIGKEKGQMQKQNEIIARTRPVSLFDLRIAVNNFKWNCCVCKQLLWFMRGHHEFILFTRGDQNKQ